MQEKPNGEVFWNKILVKPLGENKINIKDEEYDIIPLIQTYFTNTISTTKTLNDEDKSTVDDILKTTGFYSMRHKLGLKSARMQNVSYILPKAITKIRNPTIPAIENVSDDSQEEVKMVILLNIFDIYTKLEALVGLKLSGHTTALTEASNLIEELYKRGEIHNE